MVFGQVVRFNPHCIEEAWQLGFHATKRAQDVTTAVVNTLLLVVPLPFTKPALLDAGIILYILQMAASSLAVIALSIWTPDWYLRHRNAAILARQILTLLAFRAWIMPSPIFSFLHPLGIPATLLSRLRFFLFIPLLLLHASLSHPLPLHSKRVVIAFLAYVAAQCNADRCVAEMVRFPEQGGEYRRAVAAADAFLRRWVPVHPMPAVPGPPTDAELLSGFGACMATHFSLQLALGVFFPAAVLAAEETLSRKAFERRHALATAFTYRPKVLLVLNLLLLPLEAVVGFHCVARALAMAEAVAGPAPVAPPLG